MNELMYMHVYLSINEKLALMDKW